MSTQGDLRVAILSNRISRRIRCPLHRHLSLALLVVAVADLKRLPGMGNQGNRFKIDIRRDHKGQTEFNHRVHRVHRGAEKSD